MSEPSPIIEQETTKNSQANRLDFCDVKIFQTVPLGILVLDSNLRIMRINSRAAKMLNAESVTVDCNIEELCYYPADIHKVKTFVASQTKHPLYLTLKSTDNEKVQVRIHVSQIDGFTCFYLEDNAEILTLEDELHNFQSAINSADDAILLFDNDGLIFYTNPAFERQTGLPGEEILGCTIEQFWSNRVPQIVFREMWDCTNRAQTWAGELICVRNDKTQYDVEVRITPILSDEQDIVGHICVQRDITARKRIEQQLADYSENLEHKVEERTLELSKLHDIAQLFHSTNSLSDRLRMVLIAATAGESFGFNRAFLLLVDKENNRLAGACGLGPSNPEEANIIWSRIDHSLRNNPLPDALQTHLDNIGEGDVNANRITQELVTLMSDHSSILVQSILKKRSFIVNQGRTDTEFDRTIIDRLGSDQFAVIPLFIQETPIGVLVVDNIITKNPIKKENLKLFDILATQAALAIAHADAMEALAEKMEEIRTAHSELQKNQEKLIEQEKFAVLGQMAATVAHEIRTPLVAIGGFANMLLKLHSKRDADYPNLKIIRDEALRLEDVLNRLLFYAKPSTPLMETNDLIQLLYSVLAFFGEEIKEHHIQLTTRFTPNFPLIPFDRNLIRQVLINVVQNSIQSMKNGDTLHVETLEEDRWVSVLIRDTGCGIPAGNLEQIFEPFFSTKHQGTGLGLHVSQRIMASHEGTLNVDSVWEQGTTVTLRLLKERK